MSNPIRRPGDIKHLDKLIGEWADDNNMQPRPARLLVSFSVLAQLLAEITREGKPVIVVKGGASQVIRFGAKARTTRDFDTLTTLHLDIAFEELASHLEQGWEGFTGKVTRRGEISRAGTTPLPQRCEIKLAYKGKPFSTVPLKSATKQTKH